MKHISDSHGRTIWFAGKPGPMVPKNSRVVGRKGGARHKIPKSGNSNNASGKVSTSDEDLPQSVEKDDQKSKTDDNDESKSKRPKRTRSKS